ncbi:MAG: hypothetical protein Q4G68_03045 [Planctomycetia bacterium]|nr:hypothetical protein [Planctomycetia bacterium]
MNQTESVVYSKTCIYEKWNTKIFTVALCCLVVAAGLQNNSVIGAEVVTSDANRWTVVVHTETSPDSQKGLNDFVNWLREWNRNVVVFSPFEKNLLRRPTDQNIRRCLDWFRTPDWPSDSLELNRIRTADGPCEVRLLITACGVEKQDAETGESRIVFSFIDPNTSDGSFRESLDGGVSVGEIVAAMTYLNGDDDSVIDRRLIVVNLLPIPVARGANDPLAGVRGAAIDQTCKAFQTQSEGIIVVSNQKLSQPLPVNSFFDILKKGLSGWADATDRSDRVVSMRELILYVTEQCQKNQNEGTAALSSHVLLDYPVCNVPDSFRYPDLAAPVGLFARIGDKLLEKKEEVKHADRDSQEARRRESENKKLVKGAHHENN